jgi:glycosyltransferase involved in cell wall biosynthesis
MGIPPEKNAREDTSEQRRHTLIFVGRVTYSKGVQLAIEALTRLEAEYRLVVVGDGWYMPELRRQVDRLRLADRIEFTGFLRGDALERRYAESDILVVPSIWPEPAGLVVPEARGRGLKVAAFATGGLPEWAGRYGYGDIYLAQSVTAAALAAAIRSAPRQACRRLRLLEGTWLNCFRPRSTLGDRERLFD